MTTTQRTIEKINELVSAGSQSDTLVELIESLPDNVRPQGLEAILTYAISNNMHEMLSLLMSSDVSASLNAHALNQLWLKVCQEDDPGMVDVFVARKCVATNLSYKAMFCHALSSQASYAIKSLQDIVSMDDKVSALFTHGADVSPEMIKGLNSYPALMTHSVSCWLERWIDLPYSNDSLISNEQRTSRREQLRVWLSHQDGDAISRMWNAVITHGKSWIGEVLREEGHTSPKVSRDIAYMMIEDGSSDLFKLTGAAKVIEDGESLQAALSRLVQIKGQQAFIRHLIQESLPACKNFFCRLLGMPYDRLELRKISRDFRRHVKMTVNSEESSNYTRLIYVGLMVDKFGVEEVSRHACYEWQADNLMMLGHGPMELMGVIETNEIKSYLLSQMSRSC